MKFNQVESVPKKTQPVKNPIYQSKYYLLLLTYSQKLYNFVMSDWPLRLSPGQYCLHLQPLLNTVLSIGLRLSPLKTLKYRKYLVQDFFLKNIGRRTTYSFFITLLVLPNGYAIVEQIIMRVRLVQLSMAFLRKFQQAQYPQ